MRNRHGMERPANKFQRLIQVHLVTLVTSALRTWAMRFSLAYSNSIRFDDIGERLENVNKSTDALTRVEIESNTSHV